MTVKELKDVLAQYGDEYDNCLVTCYATSPCIGYANVIDEAYIGKTYVNRPKSLPYRENFWPIKRTLQLQFEIPQCDIDELLENNKKD